ncbi:hypothetical protein OIU84_004138 [Salix udensis]|uniref:Inhibitor I9 domain-containing protein n=1 Tax=Salix udensis TaxID=889485 RepID=A0AAD6P3U9_9ROSI|nr:hypothetical protein OIU84_004138 [Salix udensis]
MKGNLYELRRLIKEAISKLTLSLYRSQRGGVSDLDSWYKSFLPAAIPSSNHQERMVYSYRYVATGFAAKLTAEEAKAMKDKGWVFCRQSPKKILSRHTTHSPNFLGLQKNLGILEKLNLWKRGDYMGNSLIASRHKVGKISHSIGMSRESIIAII